MMVWSEYQRASLALWYVVNASLSSYYKLLEAFENPADALSAGSLSWQNLGIHKAHLARLADEKSTQAFLEITHQRCQGGVFGVIFLDDGDYPNVLKQLYDPPPLLFYQGNKELLGMPQLAIVGTRKPSDYAQKITFDMAQYLVQAGYIITSGLALGVDSFAHRGALTQTDPNLVGRTVGVMGTGIDVCYPPQNQGLFFDIVQSGGCLVSELLPATPASKHTFPRRNRIVTGMSLATIVTEAGIQSGSLISARLTAEQGKQVFVVPNRIDNPQAEGCHHLIREGATLIYHPNQILDELQSQGGILPTTFGQGVSLFSDDETPKLALRNTPKNPQKVPQGTTAQISKTQDTSLNAKIPEHLLVVYQVLDNDPKDLDKLVELTALSAGELLAKLTELEIYGFVKVFGGRYAKV